jgi:hypothetical protein
MENDPPLPIAVNRAPLLTLWATIVAERLGYPPETALTLDRAVCSASARTKARRLGITDEAQDAAERRAAAGLPIRGRNSRSRTGTLSPGPCMGLREQGAGSTTTV